MNVPDQAHALVKALKASPEYKEFKDRQETLKSNDEARNLLTDLRKFQWQIERLRMSGQQPTPEDEIQLNYIMGNISNNETAKNYLEGEYNFSVILNDVQRILAEAMKEIFTPELWESEEN